MNAQNASVAIGFVIGAVVMGLALGLAIGGLILFIACRLCGEKEVHYGKAVGMTAAILAVNFLIGLAVNLVLVPLAAQVGAGPIAILLLLVGGILAQLMIDGGIISSMVPTSFLKGVGIFLMQIIVVAVLFIGLALTAGGLGSLDRFLGRGKPTSTASESADPSGSPLADPASTSEFLSEALVALEQTTTGADRSSPFPTPSGPFGSSSPPGFTPPSFPGSPPGFTPPGFPGLPSGTVPPGFPSRPSGFPGPPTGPAGPSSSFDPHPSPGPGSTLPIPGGTAPNSGFGKIPSADTLAIPGTPIAWSATVDPAASLNFPISDKDINIPFPRGVGGDDLVYPRQPSPFLAIFEGNGANAYGHLFDLREGKPTGRFQGKLHPDKRYTALSPIGDLLAFKSAIGNEVQVWSFKNSRLVATASTPDPIDFVDFAGPSTLVLGWTFGKSFQVWDIDQQRTLREFKVPGRPDSAAISVSPGQKFLALTSTDDSRLRVFDLTTGQPAGEAIIPSEGHFTANCKSLAYSPDGAEIAGLFQIRSNPYIFLWNAADGTLVSSFKFEGDSDLGSDFGYRDVPLLWLPGYPAWLVNGQSVIARDTGKRLWSFPFDQQTQRPASRRLQSPTRMLVVVGPFANQALRSLPLPDEFLKAISPSSALP